MEALGEQEQAAANAQQNTKQDSSAAQPAALPFYDALDLFGRCPDSAQLPIALDLILDGDPENALDDYIAADQHQDRDTADGGEVNGLGIIGKVTAVHAHMGKAIPGGDLLAAGGHDLLAQLFIVLKMHIGAIPGRVKSGPLGQGRLGNGNGAGICFLFTNIRQDAGHGIVAMKALGVQSNRLTDFGIGTVGGQKIFADSDLVRLHRKFSLYQLHLAAGNMDHIAVAVHIGGVVAPLRVLLSQQIVFAHSGKLRQVLQRRHIGRLHAGEHRLVGVGHLIALDLRHGNGQNCRKRD